MEDLLIEEKMKNLNAKQDEIMKVLENININLQGAMNRLLIIETKNGNKVEELTIRINKLEQDNHSIMVFGGKVLDSLIKIIVGLVLAYLLFKIGLSPK